MKMSKAILKKIKVMARSALYDVSPFTINGKEGEEPGTASCCGRLIQLVD